MMLEPVSVEVNGRLYVVNPFGPSAAHEYLHAMVLARTTGRGLAALGRTALSHCLTDNGRRLEDKMVFEEHFGRYPEDLLELQSKSMDALCAPWEGKTTAAAE